MDSYHQLEFNKIREKIITDCQSPLGKDLADHIKPLKEKEKIDDKLNLSAELQVLLKNGLSYNFENVTEISDLLNNFKHQTYNFEEFKKIYYNINAANIIEIELDEPGEFPLYVILINQLVKLPQQEIRFTSIFTPEGKVKDSASSELASIRRRKKQLRKNIVSELNIIMKDMKKKNFLHDEIITQRDGRFVIPVKEGATSFVNCIIHGRSGSKSSVFIEPEETVGTNNELDLISTEEKQEIFKIKKEYTEWLQESSEELTANTKILAKLDFYFAVARFSNRLNCEIPKIIERPYINLIDAKHPLLLITMRDSKKVIPFSLELGKDYKLLLISGPNTGGKTVTLKTVGLLTLMALSGLPIPASENSKIGIFRNIFADIGDYQSLENALSTFSSHMSNIKQMVENGNSESLILIDEIGAATDPEQGSALAQAILENITQKEVTGVITTHYTALKVFAEKNDTCKNAAMQFDPTKHIPTYQFKLGLPGNSFAIEVASKLGITSSLIERAKDLAGDQNIELTELIKKMSEEKKELARQNYQQKLKTALLKQKISEYDENIEMQKKDAKNIKKRSMRDARDFLTTLQKELNQEIEDIKKEDKKRKKQLLERSFKKVNKKNKEIKIQEEKLEDDKRKPVEEIDVGQYVWLKDFQSEGEVVEITNSGIKVDMNGIYFTTTKRNLFQTEQNKRSYDQKKINIPKTKAKMELKLLGYRFEEALPELEKFLDKALLSGLNNVRIIHGKGTGALRRKIRHYLRSNKKIEKFAAPPPEAGGNGVTVVTFKN